MSTGSLFLTCFLAALAAIAVAECVLNLDDYAPEVRYIYGPAPESAGDAVAVAEEA